MSEQIRPSRGRSIKPFGNIVSWHKPADLGKIPGSDWVCLSDITPKQNEDLLRQHPEGLDDQQLRDLGGRAQYLRLSQYPEGFHSVHIIDAESGEERMGPEYTRRHDGTPDPISLTLGKLKTPIALATGGLVRYVSSQPESGTETVIRSSPDLDSFIALGITPRKRRLAITAMGQVGDSQDSIATLSIAQRDSHMWAKLFLLRKGGKDLDVALDRHGKITSLHVSNNMAINRWLGDETIHYDRSTDRDEISRPSDRAKVVNQLAKELGMDKWSDIDLKRTASRMYRAMGQRVINPIIFIESLPSS